MEFTAFNVEFTTPRPFDSPAAKVSASFVCAPDEDVNMSLAFAGQLVRERAYGMLKDQVFTAPGEMVAPPPVVRKSEQVLAVDAAAKAAFEAAQPGPTAAEAQASMDTPLGKLPEAPVTHRRRTRAEIAADNARLNDPLPESLQPNPWVSSQPEIKVANVIPRSAAGGWDAGEVQEADVTDEDLKKACSAKAAAFTAAGLTDGRDKILTLIASFHAGNREKFIQDLEDQDARREFLALLAELR